MDKPDTTPHQSNAVIWTVFLFGYLALSVFTVWVLWPQPETVIVPARLLPVPDPVASQPKEFQEE